MLKILLPPNSRLNIFCSIAFLFFLNSVFPQDINYPTSLKIDTNYAFIQFYSNGTARKLVNHFDNVKQDKMVFIHYGGSHIQAEYPTSVARRNFHERFGNGGRGLIFNYGAAKTYTSVNYSSTFTGNWKYNKSFQGRKPEIPLGVCGMTVESIDTNASLNFKFKNAIPPNNHRIYLFFENDSISNGVSIQINSTELNNSSHQVEFTTYGLTFLWDQSIQTIDLITKAKEGGKRFRFYGLSIENDDNSGIVYHSTGVGAAAHRSMLILDELPEQAAILKPDVVLLDFGTNDILYTNSIDVSLIGQIEKSIQKLKVINPEILIVLTSTQDLFYKGKYISAGPIFRDLMDSIARKNDCLFWNWYDLSGGLRTIRTWYDEGYAQKDGIHLTKKGYELKGEFIYQSFINTYDSFKRNPNSESLVIPAKNYFEKKDSDSSISIDSEMYQKKESTSKEEHPPKKTNKKSKTYSVKNGDTLSEIAEKFHVSVTQLKKANGLKNDLIRPGQKIIIPLK